jgi:hypothetical protein
MYDHYIAIDWAQENMAVARLTSQLDKVYAWSAGFNADM